MNPRSTNPRRKRSRTSHRKKVSAGFSQRRLRFESLEDRRLLATLEMGFVFRHVDADGNPGTVMTTPATITAGSDFWAELRVKDSRASATAPAPGIIALPVTVNWVGSVNGGALTNHEFVEYIGVKPVDDETCQHPTSLCVQEDNPLVTPNFRLQRFVDSKGDDGSFINLRGGALPDWEEGGDAIGTTGFEAFSQMKFRAALLPNGQPVTVCFDAALAGSMSFADADVLEGVDSQQGCIRIQPENGIPSPSSLSGFVYLDANNDGIRNVAPNGVPLEIGLPNVTIHLYRQGETTPLRTVDTGPGGWYQFEDLEPGVYRIRQEQPAAFLDGKDSLGIVMPGGQQRGEVGDDEFSNIRLNSGEHGIEYNFGERTANINKRMFLASTPKPREIAGSRQGVPTKVIEVASASVTVEPKLDDQAFQITVDNEPAQTIPFSQARIVAVENPASASRVTLIGTPAPDTAYTAPGYAVLRRAEVPITQGYGMEVVGAPTIWIDAGNGQNDRIVMRDSPRNDLFIAGDPTPGGPPPAVPAQTASLSTQAPASETGMQVFARRFQRVRAISSAGGNDQATQQAHDMALQLVGNWNL
jgi:hypothetical protein